MDNGEIQTFTGIWLIAVVSIILCRQITTAIPPGAARLLSLLPIIYLFTTLPLRLTTVHLSGPTIFYLVWLANFKLLLFAFDQGPLAAHPPLSLLHFTSIALLPIKPKSLTKQTLTSKSHTTAILLLKCFLFQLIVKLYEYRASIHPHLILLLYCCHVYLGAELVLALTAAPVRSTLGWEIEPHFDEPYLATSLQDFWGRRWNLMVTGILRPTVYSPVRSSLTPIIGKKWALLAAVVATFLVSGLMHEVIYYYMTRVVPTWEVTWFFVLHGVCVAAEVAVKRVVTWRVNGVVSGVATLGFVVVTGGWLFFPQVVRNGLDLKAIDEYYVIGKFVRDKLQLLIKN